uniref:Cysteine and histidine-rich domain-containing protein 1-like n=1 Tax=Sinocyclocheilus rhinocerous TaxID=307959 RepID=A0A673KBZ2_9TELE
MALLCYNRGCGGRFDADKNSDDACQFHPGVPIFHDALKGWSCCKKRTTDFSEFLSIKGCTRGRHSNEKPQEPLQPEVTSDKGDGKQHSGKEMIYQGPKSAEALEKERPSSDEPQKKLQVKISPSLAQIMEKMEITEREKREKLGKAQDHLQHKHVDSSALVLYGRCMIIHIWLSLSRYKYWNCCCIKTTDFNAFLDQKGCTSGKHCWIPKQDKKKVACRHDWHQTGNQVVVTIYAKNSSPEQSYVEANRTVLTCHIQFEGDKVFHKDIHLWGVIDVKSSFVNMVPSKVEVTMGKADAVAWGKLEDPKHKAEPEVTDEMNTEQEDVKPDWYISDDDISESDFEDEEEKEESEEKKEENQAGDGPPELEEPAAVPPEK